MFNWIIAVSRIFPLSACYESFAISAWRLDYLAGAVREFQRPASLAKFGFGLLQRQIDLLSLRAPNPRELKVPDFRQPEILPALFSGVASGLWSVPLCVAAQRWQRTAQEVRRTAQAMARS